MADMDWTGGFELVSQLRAIGLPNRCCAVLPRFQAGREQIMDWQPPPTQVQLAPSEVQPQAPVEPVAVKVNVTQYVPETATAVTMIVTVTPPTGTAVVYAPGYENYPTIFKGPRSMEEVRLAGPFVYVKLYGGATSFEIQYTNYRQP
jgi:hypothetical protein